ncbi:MAG: carbohydrate-binding module family 14 protein [Odoribacteraceae bacterium]|jgi:hypothetical protein|nr:carbohydrate-binding module family 14 protein [Odoribacteraceae bacterium]
MKKTITISSVMTGLLLAMAVACNFSRKEARNEGGITLEKRVEIEDVGIFHNRGLDSIFADLAAEKSRLFKESGEQPGTRSFSPEVHDYSSLILNSTKRVMKNWFPDVDENVLETAIVKNVTRSATGQISIDNEADVQEMLTPFQQEYYDRLLTIVNTENMTVDSIKREIWALEEEIEQNAPTVAEAEQLLYATSVARHSTEYWHQNLAAWHTMLYGNIIDSGEVENMNANLGEIEYYLWNQGQGLSPGMSKCIPHPEYQNCYYLIFCDSGGILHFEYLQCPSGLRFDPITCQCDWPPAGYQLGNSIVISDLAGAYTGTPGGIPGVIISAIFASTVAALVMW